MSTVVPSWEKELSCPEPIRMVRFLSMAWRWGLHSFGFFCSSSDVPGRDKGEDSPFNRPGRSLSGLRFQGNVILRACLGSRFERVWGAGGQWLS